MKFVAALFALAACGDNLPEVQDPRTIDLSFQKPSVPNRKLSICCSRSMTPGRGRDQFQLGHSMSSVFDQLRGGGSIPDLHLGVITDPRVVSGIARPVISLPSAS